ncbi:M13 family metallopeptidase [Nocardia yamanashiensis]|uniref:M13 family metallopeptidase n=1 Tax=Nocardia yamanashiensis TaxID=209247 RepID=UPI001E4C0C9B|nr:M13 family metallopeptidase [Nocardia yamanashiensis]UGT39731.1 M13 family metallopeptidase [Nocardia yamanashiensis]
MTSSGPVRLGRRTFLIALGAVPAAAALAACTKDDTKSLAGPDLSGSDESVRVQDDLYRYVNGKWLKEYQLPPDKVSVGAISEAIERTQNQLREIIDGIKDPKPGTDAQKIRDLYDARVDWDTVEKLGMTPLQGLFDQVDKAATKAELAKVMGALPISGILGIGVGIDRKNSTAYIPTVGQTGIGLDEDYYSKPQYAEKLAAYRVFLEAIAKGAGFPDPGGMAQRVFDLEKRMAAAFWDKVRQRDTDATYNRMSWAQLTELGKGFDFEPWLAGCTDRSKDLFAEVIVRQPSYVTAAGQLWAETDMAVLRDYMKLQLVAAFARYLPIAINDAYFEFWGRTMRGQQERAERWKYGVDIVNGTLPEALGKLYVDKYFPAAAKDEVKRMVDDLMTAYRENFRNSDWMTQPTRDAAIAKLDKITVKIGYPDKWDDYSKLTVTRGKLVESLLAANAFSNKKDWDRLGTPVDKTEWGMSPQTVNAYYSASNNEIVFPAAYLQPPYFDKDAQLAVNFGAVGATIGHEIGHGFDDQGRKYDGEGNLRDWWTPEDKAAFEAKAAKVVAQYDGLVPTGLSAENKVNGKLTLGENLADLRGLQIALAAYRTAEKRAGNDNPDYKSMFLGYARSWRSKQTPELTADQLNDTHSPDEFRCNITVRNLPEFYSAFGVKEGDKLFLAQDQRVTF